jgi:S-formylglutathione hydrolase FrmB
LGHYVSHLSLVHGSLPVTMQVLTAAVLAYATGWRSRSWRTVWLPAAAIVGTALAAGAYRYIGSLGVAGDPAPYALWMWIALAGLAAGVLVLGWRGARWWRRGLSLLAVPLCLGCAALAMNLWVGYFPTVRTAWSQLTARPLPNQADRITVTAMQLTGARPSNGVVVPVDISADASRFRHRREFVYLPPAWFASKPPPRLPTVMMIGSAINTPADWMRAGDAITTIDNFAVTHGGNGPALVFVDSTGAFNNDTECVNGPRGNAADHLTKDVVPFMINNFGVSARRAKWGVVGWSMGGTCAVDLTVMHPELFSAFVDIAGDLGPNTGTKVQTVTRLFGGNADAWAAFDPTTVITRHGPYAGVAGRFIIPGPPASGPNDIGNANCAVTRHDAAGNPEGQDDAATTLCATAVAHGIRCALVTQPGKHDWPFAAHALAAALPWMAAQLGIPYVPPPRLTPVSTATAHGLVSDGPVPAK